MCIYCDAKLDDAFTKTLFKMQLPLLGNMNLEIEGAMIPDTDPKIEVCVSSIISIGNTIEEIDYCKVPINYCPICGRKMRNISKEEDSERSKSMEDVYRDLIEGLKPIGEEFAKIFPSHSQY